MEEKKVPALRFRGFDNAWEQKELGELFSYLQNNTLSRAELNDNYGVAQSIHYGDVLIKYGECLDVSKERLAFIEKQSIADKFKTAYLQDGDIIVADTAEDGTVGKCTEIQDLTDKKIISGLHTIPLRPDQKFASGYLGFYMNSNSYHDQLKPLMQGIKVTSISKSAIQNTVVRYPFSLKEQGLVSRYLCLLNTLISLHQRKLEMLKKVKKSMLEKMFPKNDAKVPEVRFSDFTDAWEQRHLGEIVERVTRKNENLESTLPLTISAQYGLIDQNEFFDKRIASKDVSGYFLIRRGEFAYNKSTSTDAPWGAIKCLERYENGVLSTLYIVFRIIDEKKLNSNYLAFYYDTDLWHRGVQAIAAEGARNHGLLNIAPVDFFETTLAIPQDIFEQQKIGLFFKQLDHLISLHQRKLEKLKNIKKSMLEKMFII